MKKYLMMAVAGLALASCNKMDDYTTSPGEIARAKYNQAFLKYVGGYIHPDQDWGFGENAYSNAPAFDFTRSASSPSVAEANCPYDATWVANYLTTAKEPNSDNVGHNADNGGWERTGEDNNINWQDPDQVAMRNKFWSLSWPYTEADLQWINANCPTWIRWKADENYVTNFKITGTWNGGISVAGSEGSSSPGAERTIVVTGTWNINDGEGQRIGSLGKVIVANGGKIVISSGKTLSSVNEAQIVVLPGGEISGSGTVAYHNGTSSDLLSGNWGTINVGTFNNNGGNFYNYGTLKANKMDGGAGNSRYYNRGVVSIGETGSSANIRIYNGCQFYVRNNARIRNYEGINGSALVVDGELMFSSSADGTSEPTYVGLAGGALVKCATLYNNGTSWSGPTGTEYAALEITDKIVYLNWEQDAPQNGGYFENNIYVKAGTWDNVPGGNGYQAGETSTADYKFFQIVANCRGNKGVKKVKAGTTQFIPKDDDYVKGNSGCTPCFTSDIPTPPSTPQNDPNKIRIIAEDLSASGDSDFDFNDVVLDVTFGNPATITLTHAGGTLPLTINGHEVHKLFGVWQGDETIDENTPKQKMVNTGAGTSAAPVDLTNVLNVSINSRSEANTKLTLKVYKGGSWEEMTAPKGEPACKLAVGQNFTVLRERQSIKGEYPLFLDWVKDANFSSQWW